MAPSLYNSRPGFTPRKAGPAPFTATAAPSWSAPKVDSQVDARMRTGTRARATDLTTRASMVDEKYRPQRTDTIASTRARLAGYGGYKVGDDGSISQSAPNAQPGDLYKQSYQQNTSQASRAGIMDSSFAAKAIGAAFGRLSVEAQGIVTQHAATMNNLVAQQAADYNEINSTLIGLYGDEAQYLIDNPPPPPPQAPPAELTPATDSSGPVSARANAPGTRNEIVRLKAGQSGASLKRQGYKKAGASHGPNTWVKAY